MSVLALWFSQSVGLAGAIGYYLISISHSEVSMCGLSLVGCIVWLSLEHFTTLMSLPAACDAPFAHQQPREGRVCQSYREASR
jgi:hypothetical protein